MDDVRRNEFGLLREMHTTTSALKATMTLIVVDGMEACRKACGGHGFMLAAGIPLHLAQYMPQATYEGDFVVLSIQAGRSLLKVVEDKMSGGGTTSGSASYKYLYDFDPERPSQSPSVSCNWRCPNWQLTVFRCRSCALVYSTARTFSNQLQKGSAMLEAFDDVKVEMTFMTKAHAHVIILQSFQNAVKQATANKSVFPALKSLCDLYALHWIIQDFGQFVSAGALHGESFSQIIAEIKLLLKELRPNAVALSDAWAFPDYLLNSALGNFDGHVYETLFDSILKDPLNDCDVSDGYYRHIQYILHPERKHAAVSKL